MAIIRKEIGMSRLRMYILVVITLESLNSKDAKVLAGRKMERKQCTDKSYVKTLREERAFEQEISVFRRGI